MSDNIEKKRWVLVFTQNQLVKYWSTYLNLCPEQGEKNILLVDGKEMEREPKTNKM